MEIVNSVSHFTTADTSEAFDSVDADYLVACTVSAFGGGPSAITFDGDSFTEEFSRQESFGSSQPDAKLTVWVLPNPSQGSFTFTVDANAAGSDRYFAALFALKGVNPTSPIAGADYSNSIEPVAIPITTPYSDSIGIVFGTVYANVAGADYHDFGSGFTEAYDAQGIQTTNSGGIYLMYRIFTTSGEKLLDNGGNNADAPQKAINVAVLINGTQGGGSGNFFLVM